MSYRGNAWVNVQSCGKHAALKVIRMLKRQYPALTSSAEVLLRNSCNCYREFPAPLFWFSVSLWLWHNTNQKQLSGGKGLCCPSGYSQALREARTGTRSRNDRNTTHLLMLSWLSYIQPRTTCVGMDTTQSGLGNPMLMNNQDKPPQRGPWANLIWAAPKLRLPSQVTANRVKLTLKAN